MKKGSSSGWRNEEHTRKMDSLKQQNVLEFDGGECGKRQKRAHVSLQIGRETERHPDENTMERISPHVEAVRKHHYTIVWYKNDRAWFLKSNNLRTVRRYFQIGLFWEYILFFSFNCELMLSISYLWWFVQLERKANVLFGVPLLESVICLRRI